MMTNFVQLIWLIPFLPLLAAGILALTRQPHRAFAASISIGAMVIAFGLSCFAFFKSVTATVSRSVFNFTWFQFGQSSMQLGFVLDPLAACMLVMVTLVGTLIFIYSVGYMAHDVNFTRFFCFL